MVREVNDPLVAAAGSSRCARRELRRTGRSALPRLGRAALPRRPNLAVNERSDVRGLSPSARERLEIKAVASSVAPASWTAVESAAIYRFRTRSKSGECSGQSGHLRKAVASLHSATAVQNLAEVRERREHSTAVPGFHLSGQVTTRFPGRERRFRRSKRWPQASRQRLGLRSRAERSTAFEGARILEAATCRPATSDKR